MSTDYGWEKFHGAMLSLAGTGTIQKRLAGALVYHLIHLKPTADLPSELREEFEKLMKNLTREKAQGDEGTIAATTGKMSDSEAYEYVKKLVCMYDIAAQQQGVRRRPSRPAKV